MRPGTDWQFAGYAALCAAARRSRGVLPQMR